MRNAEWPDIQLSEQVLLSCDKQHRGCSGGWPLLAFKWIKENGITDNTCSPYQALGYRNGLGCSDLLECMECTPEGCTPKEQYHKYYVEEYGFVSGEQEMMEEIYQNGPIACSCSTPEGLYRHTEGIFIDRTNRKSFDHECEVVGFGEQNGIKFWHVKNTWGTSYADDGFFKVIRGINNIAIETNCSWATPLDTWSEGKQVVVQKNVEKSNHLLETKKESSQSTITSNYQNKVLSSRPGDLLTEEELPDSFDWRNVFGFNYASKTQNQNAPNHCDAGWAFAPSSALADRILINQKRIETTLALSPQAIINCKAGGTCEGGNPATVYEFANTHGIPDSSCFNYEGKDYTRTCNPFDVCRDCHGPPPKTGEHLLQNCRTIFNYNRYFVSEYGHVQDQSLSQERREKEAVHYMKAEIINRGPISCGVNFTENFHNYEEGIYSEKLDKETSTYRHDVSIVGWGKTLTGQQYWIGRNSYGTTWGEKGFFRIDMYEDNLGINTDCIWAIPVTDKNELSLFYSNLQIPSEWERYD